MKSYLSNWAKTKHIAVLLCGFFLSSASLFSQSSKLYFEKKIDWVNLSEAKKLNADSVEHIRLSKKDLNGDFKTELSRFKNIKSLSFKGLKLDSLDLDFKVFSQLNFLDLSKNRFVQVPEGLCEIKSLKILLLSSNPLAELPECMGNLTRLTALDCFDTELEAFPESMKSCTSLKYVDMQGIQLNQDKQNAIKAMFSNVRFNFDEPCNCF